MQVVLLSLEDIYYFALVFLLFMLIFSILGVQVFRDVFVDSRAHFDNFFWSFVTVFQVITGENWNEVLYTGIGGAGWGCTIYFVALFVIGIFDTRLHTYTRTPHTHTYTHIHTHTHIHTYTHTHIYIKQRQKRTTITHTRIQLTHVLHHTHRTHRTQAYVSCITPVAI